MKKAVAVLRDSRPVVITLGCLTLLCLSLFFGYFGNQGIGLSGQFFSPTAINSTCECPTVVQKPTTSKDIDSKHAQADSARLLAPPAASVIVANVSGIPKIMHYVFKTSHVYEAYRPFIKSCLDLNPDWQVMLWSDQHSEKLIAEHYGSFLNKYRGYRDRLEKSDSVRYIILHKFGGVYLDMDVECRRPFSQLLIQNPVEESFIKAASGSIKLSAAGAFLGEERREQTRILYGYSYCAMNSMMGSRPRHPFFALAIRKMLGMPSLNHARLSTGPDFLTGLYRLWIDCSADIGPDCQTNQPVLLYPAGLVSPLMDTSLVNWEEKCRPYFTKNANRKLEGSEFWRATGCSQLVVKGWNYDETNNSTAALHKFLHLGYGSQGHQKTMDLMKEFPRFTTFYKNREN